MPSVDPVELIFVLAIVLIILRPKPLTDAFRRLADRSGASLPAETPAPGHAAAPRPEPRRGS